MWRFGLLKASLAFVGSLYMSSILLFFWVLGGVLGVVAVGRLHLAALRSVLNVILNATFCLMIEGI